MNIPVAGPCPDRSEQHVRDQCDTKQVVVLVLWLICECLYQLNTLLLCSAHASDFTSPKLLSAMSMSKLRSALRTLQLSFPVCWCCFHSLFIDLFFFLHCVANFRDYKENGETKTETTYTYSELFFCCFFYHYYSVIVKIPQKNKDTQSEEKSYVQ